MNAVTLSEDNRRKLLEIAAEEMLEKGFQATSIGDILTKSGLSKGALYHHFPSKLTLGYAVFEEIFVADCAHRWEPALSDPDPISGISKLLREQVAEMTDEMVRLGCPINNFGQEMSPIDEGFRQRINREINHWRDELEAAFKRGQAAGNMKTEIDTRQVATFFVASIEGAIGIAKNAQDRALLETCAEALIGYLEGLRP
ncbi:MAG: TetR/AcrR family transcriptional regulator [Thiotrichaceae bacterium]|nr:TetR/AcrR family transcriptional regulator [Thiotrichaceae bacterium]